MRLTHYLTELSFQVKLDSYTIMSEKSDEFVTHFRTQTKEFYFSATKANRIDPWWVEFYRYEAGQKSSKFETMKDMNKEETIQVFSGVKKSLEDFLTKYKPEEFTFSAEDRSHQRFYDIAAKKIAKGYKLETLNQKGRKAYKFIRI